MQICLILVLLLKELSEPIQILLLVLLILIIGKQKNQG